MNLLIFILLFLICWVAVGFLAHYTVWLQTYKFHQFSYEFRRIEIYFLNLRTSAQGFKFGSTWCLILGPLAFYFAFVLCVIQFWFFFFLVCRMWLTTSWTIFTCLNRVHEDYRAYLRRKYLEFYDPEYFRIQREQFFQQINTATLRSPANVFRLYDQGQNKETFTLTNDGQCYINGQLIDDPAKFGYLFFKHFVYPKRGNEPLTSYREIFDEDQLNEIYGRSQNPERP